MPKSIEKPIEDVDDLPLEAAALSALHSLRHDTTDFTDVSNDKANDNNNIEDEGISPPTTTTEPTGDEKTPYSDAPHTNTREASRKRNTPAAYNDSKTSKSVSKSTTPRKSDQPIDLAPQELGKYVRGLVAPPDTGIKEKARRDTSKVLSELAGQKKDDEEGKEGDEDITFDDSGGGFNDDEGVVNGVSNYTLCHIICSYLMFISYAHILCSYLIFTAYYISLTKVINISRMQSVKHAPMISQQRYINDIQKQKIERRLLI